MTILPVVTFYDTHRPPLEDGTYQVKFEQAVKVGENSLSPPIIEMGFHVSGPRFNLSSGLVHSVFPPKGGKGDYRADLPKLVLNRSTLPWERSPSLTATSTSAGWLLLLLIDESEMVSVKEQNNVMLSGASTEADIQQAGTSLGTINVGGDLSFHQHAFNSLAVDSALVSSLLPTSLDELQYLSYARIKEGEEEQGVLMCNRLPQAGSNSTVYLVSVENNYDSTGVFTGVSIKSPTGSTSDKFFPYYDKWSFYTLDEQLYAITEELVSNITKANPTVTLPDLSSLYGQLFTSTDDFLANAIIKTISATKPAAGGQSPLAIVQQATMLPGSTFHGLMSNLSGGFQALTLAPTATDITSVGTVQLPFQQLVKNNEGDYAPSLTNAYYRSPLVAATINMSNNPTFPSHVANATTSTAFTWSIPTQGTDLLFKGTGGTDTTYAAAFELGRLMAINNTVFAKDFVNWKVQTAAALRAQKNGVGALNHIVQNTQPQLQIMPESVKDQFVAWSQLNGIPYSYLVPDATLLPTESLRYFYIDINWVNAFLCGAFSIGYTVPADLTSYLNDVLLSELTVYQGFLLNSFAVSGWPDYDVDVYSAGTKLLDSALVFRKNLATDITMALYQQKEKDKQIFDELRFHLHHSKVHSGFLYENGQYKKILNSGGTIGTKITADITPNRTIKSLVALAEKIKAKSVSEFAAGMLEGTAAVRFSI